jgi:hypothetical protein
MSDAFPPLNSNAALFAALVKATAEIGTVVKGSKAKIPTKSGGSFEYTYAALPDIIATVRPTLAEHGLGFVQDVQPSENGKTIIVSTIIFHESGASIRLGAVPVSLADQDPKTLGGAVTYGCKYSLLAALAIPREDDDGQGVSKAQKEAREAAERGAKAEAAAKEERRAWLQSVADAASAKFDKGDALGALEEWQTIPENDDKKDAWFMFRPTTCKESAMRTALTKLAAEIRARDAEIAKMPGAVKTVDAETGEIA